MALPLAMPQPTGSIFSIPAVSHAQAVQPTNPTPALCEDFTSAYLKGIIPDIYNEMLNNSALGTILNAYFPNGIDTSKFGKVIRVNYKAEKFKSRAQMLARIPVMIGRNYKDNNLILKVRVIRSVVDYTQYDNYLLAIHFIDLNVKGCRGMAKLAEKACLFTDFTPYDSTKGDFKGFLIDLVQQFNSSTYTANFLSDRKDFYDRLKVAAARF